MYPTFEQHTSELSVLAVLALSASEIRPIQSTEIRPIQDEIRPIQLEFKLPIVALSQSEGSNQSSIFAGVQNTGPQLEEGELASEKEEIRPIQNEIKPPIIAPGRSDQTAETEPIV